MLNSGFWVLSGKNGFDDAGLGVDTAQAHVGAPPFHGEAAVVDAEQMKKCGVEDERRR